MTEPDADVVVIGGGPSGSTAATMLARKGWRVRLFEREHFPREHIGESLLPASIPILQDLGVLPAIEAAGFLHKWGATMVWGASREPWSWYFREGFAGNPHSFQVWRPQFDQILLENSRAHGVEVFEGHRVLDVLFEGERAAGVRVVADGREQTVLARFIVDASGLEGLLGRKLALRQPDEQFRNLAIFAYFTGAERLPPPDETNIFIESYSDGWTWMIPLHTGWMSVGFVMDSKAGQELIRSKGIEAAYQDQLARSTNAARMLRNGMMVSGPKVIRDWSYLSTEVGGDGYALVGDAACFIDPLFSTGVHVALTAGVLGAAYVTTALKDPGMREATARAYKEVYYQHYQLFRELARLFYASNRTIESYFWEMRRVLGAEGDTTPRAAFIRAAAGQPPQGYERVVIERGDAPPEFINDLHAAEGARAARQQSLAAIPPKARAGTLLALVPVLAPGARVERMPVLTDGEFVWRFVITTPQRIDHPPISPVVAELIKAIDGQSTVAAILEQKAVGLDEATSGRLAEAAFRTIEILYIDGIIAELRGLSPGKARGR
ncbi:MAG: FAD-dependent oxidoreductase [Dehalococcoidia bacterium]